MKNKKRFGLRVEEEAMILETLDFYYPEVMPGVDDIVPTIFSGDIHRMAAKSASLQMWLRKKMVGP